MYLYPLFHLFRMHVIWKRFPDYWHLKKEKPQLPPMNMQFPTSDGQSLVFGRDVLDGSWSLESSRYPLFLAPRPYLFFSFKNLSSFHFHVISPPLTLDPNSTAIWHPLPIWSLCPHAAASVSSSMPPLEWPFQNENLVMS